MVFYITIGIPHRSEGAKAKVILGPEAGYEEHRAKFRELTESRAHPDFERVEVIGSNHGTVMDYNFRKSVEAPVPAKAEDPSDPPNKHPRNRRNPQPVTADV